MYGHLVQSIALGITLPVKDIEWVKHSTTSFFFCLAIVYAICVVCHPRIPEQWRMTCKIHTHIPCAKKDSSLALHVWKKFTWLLQINEHTKIQDFIHIANMGVEYFLKHDDIKFWTWILLTIRQTVNWILPYSII